MDRYLKSSDIVELSLIIKNDENKMKIVTTDDCRFFLNGKIVKTKYENPIEIVRLRKNEEIKLSFVSKEGIAKENNSWSAVSAVHFYQNDDSEQSYTFNIESLGQYDVGYIFNKACDVMMKKLDIFKQMVKDAKVDDNELVMVIENETYTLGNIVASYLQQDKNVVFASYKIVHPLIEKIDIFVKTKGIDVKKCVLDNMDKVIGYYKDIQNSLD
jgi:DNA-directed RNA polymerase subunit L